MQLLSARAGISLFAALLLTVVLTVLGVSPLVALVAGLILGPVFVSMFLGDVTDRAERWLTTPRPPSRPG